MHRTRLLRDRAGLLVARPPRSGPGARHDGRGHHGHELPPIEVVGSIAPAAGPTIGSGVPARVTTLDARRVDAYEPRMLSDALKTVAGFSTYDDLGSPYKLNLSSRGFYSSPVVGLPQGVAVFLDGVRMNEPEASQVNFDLLPMDHIQRIEMLSGNGSLLGRNALGGAVNLVTARGTGPTAATIELSGGSFGAAPGGGHVSGLTTGGFDWYVGGNYNREDGWREVTGAEGYQGFVNVGKLGETERHPLPGLLRQLAASRPRARCPSPSSTRAPTRT